MFEGKNRQCFGSFTSSLIEILKIVVALAVIVAVVRYVLTQGLPPRGKGRWRNVLNVLSDRSERHKR
jgi:hypothetical protein